MQPPLHNNEDDTYWNRPRSSLDGYRLIYRIGTFPCHIQRTSAGSSPSSIPRPLLQPPRGRAFGASSPSSSSVWAAVFRVGATPAGWQGSCGASRRISSKPHTICSSIEKLLQVPTVTPSTCICLLPTLRGNRMHFSSETPCCIGLAI